MLLLKLAPVGNVGLTLHVTGLPAQLVSAALGADIASADCSCTAAGLVTDTVTVPAMWVTVRLSVPVPLSPVAAVAVRVNGP